MDCEGSKALNDIDYDLFASIDLMKMEEEVRSDQSSETFDTFDLPEVTNFRSRCNTWPRQQLQQQLQQQQQQHIFMQQPTLREYQELGSVKEFGSSSALNSIQGGSFMLANRLVAPSPSWRPKAVTQNCNSGCSPPSASSSGGGVLPLVSEEETLDEFASILTEDVNTIDLDLVSPDASSMDTGSPCMVGEDGLPAFGSSSSAELSPKQKTTTRRNPWGNMSYADLITQAIKSSTDQRLTLAQIYEWLVKNVSYFREKGDNVSSTGWKNSIRHNLSLHSRFVRVQNEGSGKSSWWMLNPEAAKQAPNNQVSKHPRRRANTLESVTMQSFRQGRRGRGASNGAGSSIRRRDSSGSAARGTTPILGRRSDAPLERAASSHSIFYPDSPVFVRNSPEYNPLSGLALPSGSTSSFAGPIRCRTLSNASSCAGGGRMSPFRPRASSAYSLDGSTTTTTSPSAWNCQSPTSTFNLTEKLQIQDQAEEDELDSKENIILSQEDLDAMKMLDMDFDSSQLLLSLSQTEVDIDKLKVELVKQEQEQQQQQQMPVNSEAVPLCYLLNETVPITNGNQTKVAHKIKILEPRESPSESGYGREMWFNNRHQTPTNNVQTTSTASTKLQNDNTLVQNNNNNSASTISSCDISGLNVDFLFNDKVSPSVNSITNCQDNPEYLSFVDDFLKNTFPSTASFDSTDLETSIDMMNIEQQQPFIENTDTRTSTSNIPTTSSAFYSSTNATYHNRLQNSSPATSSALSLGTF